MIFIVLVSSMVLLSSAGCQELAGFKAKALCSHIFNSHREVASIARDDLTILLGLENLMPTDLYLFSEDKKVETNFFGSRAVACYREGLGATLLYHMTEEYNSIPSWADFKKDELVEKGYHPVKNFNLTIDN